MVYMKFKNLKNINIFSSSRIKEFFVLCSSIFFLWVTINKSGITLREVSLDKKQFLYFLSGSLCFVFSIWIHSLRTKLLWIENLGKSGSIKTYSSIIIGNFYNCILPGNLGEAVRALHFSKKNRVPLLKSFAALITEKWIDAQVFFLLALLLFYLSNFLSNTIFVSIVLTSSIIFLLSIVQFITILNRKFEKRLLSIFMFFKKHGILAVKLYYYTTGHIKILNNKKFLKYYIGLGLIVFLLNVIQFYLISKASGISAPISGIYCGFLTALSMMIIAIIPSAPSNLGVMHYGVYSVLFVVAEQYNIKLEPEVLRQFGVFAILTHLSFFIPEVLQGLIYVLVERKTLFS